MQRKWFNLVALVVIVSILMTACQPTATPAPAASDVGTAAHPIKVLFVPSVDAGVIVTGGEVMKTALEKATGLKFEVKVPTSYAATIEEMCASPTDTMGFIPALGYVLANQRCGVEVGGTAVRNGLSWYSAMFLVARDSTYKTVKDLAGKKWAFPDEASTSGYLYPFSMLKGAGVETGEQLAAGGHPQAVLAVYNGQADFATAFYSPPLVPKGMANWKWGDNPEPFDLTKDLPQVKTDDAGKKTLWAGDYQILDARANVIANAPDILEKTRILILSDQIPNDSVSFSPQFPQDTRDKIIQALVDFSKTAEWKTSIGSKDFYNWSGLEKQSDSFYNPVRALITNLGLTDKDILK
jgi:phosphonate transport system substrate-binding protein